MRQCAATKRSFSYATPGTVALAQVNGHIDLRHAMPAFFTKPVQSGKFVRELLENVAPCIVALHGEQEQTPQAAGLLPLVADLVLFA